MQVNGLFFCCFDVKYAFFFAELKKSITFAAKNYITFSLTLNFLVQ